MRQPTPFVLGLALTLAASAPAEPKKPADVLARGQYLAERVGMCQDCHTPRNEKGEFVKEQWLMGAELPFKPVAPMPWLGVAPPIAGLPTLTTEQAVAFFQTGERPGKPHVLPPMPEYRFDEADARALAAYLKSLAK
jgi:mono/diheme cytochrome c family protein